MKLYELAENYHNLLDLMENEDVPKDVLENVLGEVSEQIESKVENCAKVLKMLEGNVNSIKSEIDRLTKLKKTCENNVKNIKGYIESCMDLTGKNKIQTDLFKFSIQKNPASVDVINPDVVPAEFLIPQPCKIDKETILAALKNGVEINGCQLKQTTGLRIK